MEQPCSYAWRGWRGVGKRTQLLHFIEKQAQKTMIPFEVKKGTWFLNKQTNNADPDEDDDDATGKSIPYEESALHLGFDVARMSMSDKVFLQSILTRWTGQQDVCLMTTSLQTRYLVLYHAHFLTDESVLQLQECLEQYPTFSILLTTEFPICSRLRDFCFEIPVVGEDHLLANYTKRANLSDKDIWMAFFKKTVEDWSTTKGSAALITDIRNWIYTCLQRNLRWTDVLMYWVLVIYDTPWITPKQRGELMKCIWNAESGSGWVLVTSYRIPILWEHVHLQLARMLYRFRSDK
jgi:hypothetical protein